MNETIAVINAGSSSIKFALYDSGPAETLQFKGQIEQIGVAPHLIVRNKDNQCVAERDWPSLDHRTATQEVLKTAVELIRGAPVVGVGHRVVHGGAAYAKPVFVDAAVIEDLAKLIPLAPLHQPHNLAPIRAIAEAAPQIPQVACFDTAFHRSMPRLAELFALPRKYTEAGIRRYGFHGLSYEFVASRLKEVAPEIALARVVIAHLGNGASLCAVFDGRSIASTMGFTAVDGLVMGTRTGAIDPGVLIYLMDAYGLNARDIEKLIYKESGLLGVSGISSDMRKLHTASSPAAAEAIALFVYRIVREVGSLAAALGGLDALVFTGGIGENDATIRTDIAQGCGWLGLRLDGARNSAGAGRISADASSVLAMVVPTDEERMVARHTRSVLRSRASTL